MLLQIKYCRESDEDCARPCWTSQAALGSEGADALAIVDASVRMLCCYLHALRSKRVALNPEVPEKIFWYSTLLIPASGIKHFFINSVAQNYH